MIARYASSITTATAVTFSLFHLMQILIVMQPGIIAEPRSRHPLVMIRPDRERPVKFEESLPNKDFIKPPIPPPRGSENLDGPTVGRPEFRNHPMPDTKLHDIEFRMTDGPLVTMMRVQPNYPPALAQKGIEGYVIVRFDVTRDGSIQNIAVVESSHRGFERNALQAAKRFRYKPRVVDGVAQATTGVRYLFRFEMNH